MNRTLSCTVGEHFLIKTWWWLKQNGHNCESISGIARLAVQTVASQLDGMPPQEVIDQFRQTFENVGRTTRNASSTRQALQGNNGGSFGVFNQTNPYEITPREKPYWEVAGCPSKETFDMWTQFLIQNGLNKDSCSYSDYVKRQAKKGAEDLLARYKAEHGVLPPTVPEFAKNMPIESEIPLGCDASLPIAVNDSPEELELRVQERMEREKAEKLEMESFVQLMKQQAQPEAGLDEMEVGSRNENE